jgi:NAD(P)-dependent dehydrogenase (short-subunit alcohol dehydrogenase family)
MSDELRFDGRVALVTGGGGSIGASHARLLTERGAKVVINDYNTTVGGDADDPGENRGEQVAQELRDLGAEAVSNPDSVADAAGAQKMVQTALDHFGQLDIIVNNAGIAVCDHIHQEPGPLYERNFKILLEGPMYVVRAAWEHMKERQYGRILNTSSASIFGFNWPDGNWMGAYVLAKSAIAAYTKQIGGYGEQFGIKANAIMPLAYSRMNWDSLKDTPEGDFMKTYATTELVAGGSGYLLHEECPVSGQLFSVAAGRVARVVWAEPLGFHAGDATPESVRDNWDAVMGEVDDDRKLLNFYEVVSLVQESELMMQSGVGT